MQSGAPQPLGTYAWSYLDPVSNLPAWSTLTDDGPMDFGVRIAGVPDGGMTVAMLGLAMSGLVWLRRRLGVC
jgi:hypothetical protein